MLKWVLTVAWAGVLTALVVCCFWECVYCQFDGVAVGVAGGAVGYGPVIGSEFKVEFVPMRPEVRLAMWSEFAIKPKVIVGGPTMFPLWIPLFVLFIPATILWRRDRRPAPGACRCGYDLTGNTSGRCPECGSQT
jgi:hypothetical protein